MSAPAATLPADLLLEQDAQSRLEALDVARSFLVQAPAGSGKTQLLTQRLLALLGVADEPEEVLAITFTKAATAEMRGRVLGELRRAQGSLERGEAPEQDRLAMAALERSRLRGWRLLEQPQRLNIQTIDSLCLRIAHEAPLLSRLGGQLQPTEDAQPLYALAARRTLERLGGANADLTAALEHLLRLRDVHLGNGATLIAEMLGRRDLWLEEFSQSRSLTEQQWNDLRAQREAPLREERDRVRLRLRKLIEANPGLFQCLLELAAYACGNGPEEGLHALGELPSPDALQDMAHFLCVRKFLLTQKGEWRKRAHVKLGFPPAKQGGSATHKADFERLLLDMREIEGLLEALCALDSLPDPVFNDDEWRSVRAIFTVLLHAAAELRVLFAERSVIDFVEAGITAGYALRDDETRRRWSQGIRHLLVDEFQDTSRRQYALLKEIVRDWDPAEERTCFLVGDPMQSIYLFRNAELALFDEVRRHGFGPDAPAIQFTHLTLARNYRSDAGIVGPINSLFAGSRRAGAARFTPAVANADTPADNALHLHAEFFSGDSGESGIVRLEAERAVSVIRAHLPRMEKARAEGKEFRVGVLARAKQHVAAIAAELRAAQVPYRAVELETLEQRQEVRDLLSLLRALTHPMDRIAWLSVLRSPWCGLSLADLHTLSGGDDPDLQGKPMRALLDERAALLSEDGQRRARHMRQALESALAARYSGAFAASPNGFAAWVEAAWTALGGPRCLDENERQNAGAFFQLLATLTPDGREAAGQAFEQRLARLFARPDPRVAEACGVQLMTIHKAKGLGFDVVLVPGMHRGAAKEDAPLLRWMVRNREDSAERELLMAPIGAKGEENSATYKWLAGLQKRERRMEIDRLLYVACTRARRELHLFAALEGKKAGAELAKPAEGSLLACGWAYLRPIAEEQRLAWQAPAGAEALAIAAQAERATQMLRRLPLDWPPPADNERAMAAGSLDRLRLGPPLDGHMHGHRQEGGPASRARGVVLHAVFEKLSALAADDPKRDLSRSPAHWSNVANALLRNAGLHGRELNEERKAVLAMLRGAAGDPDGRWLLGRRAYARSESAWTMVENGDDVTLRCDRVFLAGAEPGSDGESHLWIVDYKTAAGDGKLQLQERERHEAQLRRYARALRAATGDALPLRLGLYYPVLPHLLWWPA